MKSNSTHDNPGKSYFYANGNRFGSIFYFRFCYMANGILIPYLKIACELSNFQALLVAFAFYIAYTIMALPSAYVLKLTGLKNGMMVGLWVIALVH